MDSVMADVFFLYFLAFTLVSLVPPTPFLCVPDTIPPMLLPFVNLLCLW